MQDQLLHKLKDLVEDSLKGTDLFLVDLELKGGSQNVMVWVYIESEEGGVSLDQCADVNKQLGLLIEANEVFTHKYTINVSSPGLDRPLKDLRQYSSNKGRQVSIKFKDNEEEKLLSGKLWNVEKDNIYVNAKDGNKYEVRFNDIIETKIEAVI
ncbi:MAG: ribosome maturation factor [Balneolales bacterium]